MCWRPVCRCDGIKYWFYNKVINYAVQNSEKIITVSKFSAKDVKDYFKLNDKEFAKVQVVYEGVTIPELQEEKKIFLPKKFFLYVGNAYPHKNLELLVSTFKDFLQEQPDFCLLAIFNHAPLLLSLPPC